MEPHVRTLMRLRAQAPTKLMNQMFKLLSNILYGKSIQGVRSYCEMYIVTTDELLQKLSQQRYFKDIKRVNDEVYLIQMTRKRIFLNRAIMVGQQILDLSRLMFYKLLYGEIARVYTRRFIHVHMSDTDSLLLRIKHPDTSDPYLALLPIKHILDTTKSNFAPDHFLFTQRTADELPGLLKIEHEYPQQIERGYFLRAKCYLVILSKNGQIIRTKGIDGNEMKERHFQSVLTKLEIVKADQVTIRSILSRLHTIHQRKTAMGPSEYKRFYINPYVSVAYGDYRIPALLLANQ